MEDLRIHPFQKDVNDNSKNIRIHNILNLLQQREQQSLRNSTYASKFLRNFQPTKELGDGSFGAVRSVQKLFLTGSSTDILTFQPNPSTPSPSFTFEKNFAIKLIPNFDTSLAGNEIKSLYNLIHPHIVKCYNVWIESIEDIPDEEWNYIQNLLPKENSIVTIANNNSSCCSSSEDSSSNSYNTNGESGQPGASISSSIRDCIFLQYELCYFGTLETLLNSKTVNYQQNQNLFMQILEGLLYLEFNEIVHSDLKPNNIFLSVKPDGTLLAKIGDFGLSMLLTEVHYTKDPKAFASIEVTLDALSNRQIYHAPEYLKGIFTHKGDIYSFGLIFLTMLCPFNSSPARRYAVLDAMDPEPRRKYPRDILKFPLEFSWIRQMVSHQETQRPLASQLKEMINSSAIAGYKIEYGNPMSPSQLDTIASFGFAFLHAHDLKNAYLYWSQHFYEALRTFQADDDKLIKSVSATCLLELKLGRYADSYYKQSLYVSYLESTLGQDNPVTLRFQNMLSNTLRTLIGESQQTKAPRVREMCLEISNKIQESPVYKRLAENDPLKLKCDRHYCILAVTNCDEEIFKLELNENELPSSLSPPILEHLYLGLEKINEILEIQIKYNFDTEDEAHTKHIKANILSRLGHSPEANEIFLCEINSLLNNPKGRGLLDIITLQLVYDYTVFLMKVGNFKEAKPYCEAICNVFIRRREFVAQAVEALGSLVVIYGKLGLWQEAGWVVKYQYVKLVLDKDAFMLVADDNTCDLDQFFNSLGKLKDSRPFVQHWLKRLRGAFNDFSNTESNCATGGNSLSGDCEFECHKDILLNAEKYQQLLLYLKETVPETYAKLRTYEKNYTESI